MSGVPAEQPFSIKFEGKEVHATKLVIKGVNRLEIGDRELQIDDVVHLEVEARVTGVQHVVNDKDGTLERIQNVKAIEVDITPWNRDDPNDTGVVREV